MFTIPVKLVYEKGKEKYRVEDKLKYRYEYPRPALTADCVIFGFDGKSLRILLIERGVEPYRGSWALPGGFMRMDETIDECAHRELREETGIEDIYLEQCHVFSSVARDPRGRVVTVAFIALVRPSDYKVIGGDDASRAEWFDFSSLPPLAFDHREIVDFARNYLKEILRLRPIAFRLLDEMFTIDELRRVYEVINDTRYDRRNFERKAMQSDMIAEIPENEMDSIYSPSNTSTLRRGRPPRFFKSIFRSKKSEGVEDASEDASIKDLFDF